MVFALILAGGKGSRMSDVLPKPCQKIKGIPMLQRIINTLLECNIFEIAIVCSPSNKNYLKVSVEAPDHWMWIEQSPALGTGHAVQCALKSKFFKNQKGEMLIMNADMPFLKPETILNMTMWHVNASILTCKVKNPYGYGRIVEKGGIFSYIVEEKDASPQDRQISIVNGGLYMFDIDLLRKFIFRISKDNSQDEYYLTDVFNIINEKGYIVKTIEIEDEKEIFNVNTQEQLKFANSDNRFLSKVENDILNKVK